MTSLLPLGTSRHTLPLSPYRVSSISYFPCFGFWFLFFFVCFCFFLSFHNTQCWDYGEKEQKMVLTFWMTCPRSGMSISFPAASQHGDVFNTLNETWRSLLVIKYSSLTLHLEKILIVFQHIVKAWKANLMILVCFSHWMNSHRRKFKVWHCYSTFGQRLAGMHCYNWKHGQTKTDGGDNALNLQPQRTECKGWSRIELRILDSTRLQKASIWGGPSLRASL